MTDRISARRVGISFIVLSFLALIPAYIPFMTAWTPLWESTLRSSPGKILILISLVTISFSGLFGWVKLKSVVWAIWGGTCLFNVFIYPHIQSEEAYPFHRISGGAKLANHLPYWVKFKEPWYVVELPFFQYAKEHFPKTTFVVNEEKPAYLIDWRLYYFAGKARVVHQGYDSKPPKEILEKLRQLPLATFPHPNGRFFLHYVEPSGIIPQDSLFSLRDEGHTYFVSERALKKVGWKVR